MLHGAQAKLSRAPRRAYSQATLFYLFTPKSLTTFGLSVRYWSSFKQTAKETILAWRSVFITCINIILTLYQESRWFMKLIVYEHQKRTPFSSKISEKIQPQISFLCFIPFRQRGKAMDSSYCHFEQLLRSLISSRLLKLGKLNIAGQGAVFRVTSLKQGLQSPYLGFLSGPERLKNRSVRLAVHIIQEWQQQFSFQNLIR